VLAGHVTLGATTPHTGFGRTCRAGPPNSTSPRRKRSRLSVTVPESVTDRPRAFVTLTPPSFGRVHNRAFSSTGKALRCPCGERHHEHDPRIGGPVDPDTYDYVGAVLWQAHTGVL
jgi:replication initiator protein RepSA